MNKSSAHFNFNWILGLVLFGFALASPMLFQNCGQPMHTTHLPSDDPGTLQTQSEKLRQFHCASCHDGSTNAPSGVDIMKDEQLISKGWIRPGDPNNSILYQSLLTNMPQGGPRLSDSDIAVFARWIETMTNSPARLMISENSPVSLGIVTVGSSLDHTFTVINTGDRAATQVSFLGLTSPFGYVSSQTCGATIYPGTPCTVIVRFQPQTAGQMSDSLEISYSDGVNSQPVFLKLDVQGEGSTTPSANVRLASGTTGAFGVVLVGSSKTLTLTVQNVGSGVASALAIAGLAAPFGYEGVGFPGTSGTCGATLAASSSCTIVLRFTPTAAGAQTQSVNLKYNSGTSAQTVALTVSGTGGSTTPGLYYSEIRQILNDSACNSCHMGNHGDWGSTYATLLAFKNPTTLATAAIQPGNSNSRFITAISTGTPQGHLMGGGGSYGILTVTDRQKIINWILSGAPNDPSGAPAVLTLSDGPSYIFGDVNTGASAEHTFTVTNTGPRNATALAGASFSNTVFSFKGGAYPGAGGTCGSTLSPTSTCTVIVRFSPIAVGTQTESVTINYDDGTAARSVSRALSGNGVGVGLPHLSFQGSPTGVFQAATAGDYSSLVITVINDGAAPISNDLKVIVPSAPFIQTGGSCAGSLAVGATCSINVRFAPTTAGDFSAPLALTYGGNVNPKSLSLTLKGQGLNIDTGQIQFAAVDNILKSKCLTCHSPTFANGMITNYESLLAFKYSGQTTPAIDRVNPANSRFITAITTGTSYIPGGGHIMGKTVGYGSLLSSDVEILVNWILQGQPKASFPTYYKPMIGDRYYVSSVLKKVFGETDAFVQAQVKDLVERADLRGAPCNTQDLVFDVTNPALRNKPLPAGTDRCYAANAEESRLSAEILPDASAVADAMRITVCMQIAAGMGASGSDFSIEEVLTRANLTPSSPFDAASVTKAYNQFYPGSTPSAVVTTALINIGLEAQRKLSKVDVALRPREGWRFIFVALCSASGWQAP